MSTITYCCSVQVEHVGAGFKPAPTILLRGEGPPEADRGVCHGHALNISLDSTHLGFAPCGRVVAFFLFSL